MKIITAEDITLSKYKGFFEATVVKGGKRHHIAGFKKAHKLYIEKMGTDKSYLVNDWTAPNFNEDGGVNDTVYYFATRKAAIAFIVDIANALEVK